MAVQGDNSQHHQEQLDLVVLSSVERVGQHQDLHMEQGGQGNERDLVEQDAVNQGSKGINSAEGALDDIVAESELLQAVVPGAGGVQVMEHGGLWTWTGRVVREAEIRG